MTREAAAGRCPVLVSRAGSFSSFLCNAEAGHGAGGRYCKTHALKHPAEPPKVVATFYEVDRRYREGIRRRDAQRVTASTVVLMDGTKQSRSTEHCHLFETYEAARAKVVADAEATVRAAENRLHIAREKLVAAYALPAVEPTKAPK